MPRPFRDDAAIHIMAALMGNSVVDHDYQVLPLARQACDAAEVLDYERKRREAERECGQRGGADLVHEEQP